jgi:hypothetical protein
MEPDYRRASLDNRQGHPVPELHDPCVAAFYWTAAASLTILLVDRPTCLQDGAAQLQIALGRASDTCERHHAIFSQRQQSPT